MEVEGENLESTSPNQNEKPESKRKRGRPSNATANENSTAPKKTFPNIPKNPNKVENPNEPIYLPRTTIVKIVKRQLPAEARLGKNESLVFQKAATIFIAYLTHFATEILKREGKQTLTGKQVLEALDTIEFREFVATLTQESQQKLTSPKKPKTTKNVSINNNDEDNEAIVVEGEELEKGDNEEEEGSDRQDEVDEGDDDEGDDEDEGDEDEGDEDEGDEDEDEDEGDDNMDEDISRKKFVAKRKS